MTRQRPATAACQIVVFPIRHRSRAAAQNQSGAVRNCTTTSSSASRADHGFRCGRSQHVPPLSTLRLQRSRPRAPRVPKVPIQHAKRRGPPRCRPAHPSACCAIGHRPEVGTRQSKRSLLSKRRRRVRRNVASPMLVGTIASVFAVVLLAGGGWALWKDRVDRDASGFVSIGTASLRTDAMIVGDLHGGGPSWPGSRGC